MFTTDYEVDFSKRDPLPGVSTEFYRRWSPRSFRKVEIPENVLHSLFDATRWSNSAYNEQPWLFVTSSGEGDFPVFLDLLVESNQAWAKSASVLGFIFGRKRFTHNNKPNRWSFFDAGAAWMALSQQANRYGLYTHGMAGIHIDKVCPALGVPEEDYEVICGFAIGAIDSPEKLSEPLKKMESPSGRRALEEIWKQGSYQG